MSEAQQFIATQTAATLSNKESLDQVFDALLERGSGSFDLDLDNVIRLYNAVLKGAIAPGWTIDEAQNEFLLKGLKVIKIICKIKPSALTTKSDDDTQGYMYDDLFRQLVPLLEEEEECSSFATEVISTIISSITEHPKCWSFHRQALDDLLASTASSINGLRTLDSPYRTIQRSLMVFLSIIDSGVYSKSSADLYTDSITQMLTLLVGKIWDFLKLHKDKFKKYEQCHVLLFKVCARALSLPGEKAPWAQLCLMWIDSYLELANDISLTGPLLDLAVFFRHQKALNTRKLELKSSSNTPNDVASALKCVNSALTFGGIDFEEAFSRPEWTAKRDLMLSDNIGLRKSLPQLLVFCKGPFRNLDDQEKKEMIAKLGRLVCKTAGSTNFTSAGWCKYCDLPEAQQSFDSVKHDRPPGKEFIRIFDAIIEDVSANSAASVKLELLKTLKRFVAMYEPMGLESTVGVWIRDCLAGYSRLLRIAAGKLLPYFILSRLGTGKVLKIMGDFDISETSLAETTIMAWGQVARVCTGTTLNAVLLRLLEGLVENHSLINSLTAHELQAIAKYSKLSVYQLCTPFWSTISIDVVKRVNTNKGYLIRFSELVGISPEEFLHRTSSYTLPYLVLWKEYDIIKQVSGAEDINELRQFYLKHMGEILAVLLVHILRDDRSIEDPLAMVQVLIYDCGLFQDVEFGTTVFPFLHVAVFETMKHYDGDNYELIIAALQTLSSIKYRHGLTDLLNDNTVPQIVIFASGDIKNLKGMKPYTLKIQCLHALSLLMMSAPKTVTAKVVPQICANLQWCLDSKTVLQQAALQTWLRVVQNLEDQTLRSIINLTFAFIVQRWDTFSLDSKAAAKSILEYIIKSRSNLVEKIMIESGVPSLSSVSELSSLQLTLSSWIPKKHTPFHALRNLLQRCEDESLHVVRQTIMELKELLKRNEDLINSSSANDRTVNEIRQLMRTLLNVSSRFPPPENDIAELCAECLGIIGAMDHHRVNITPEKHNFVLVDNFDSGEESKELVSLLLENYLIKTYRASTDPNAQLFLAWGIQELLKFCNLTISTYESSDLWNQFSSISQSTLIPLLSSKYSTPKFVRLDGCSYPIFTSTSSHSKWLKSFAFDLMSKVKGRNAEQVFHICLRATRSLNQNGLLTFVLPYAALNVILSGSEEHRENILEEVITVLQSPVEVNGFSRSSFHQTIFVLVDYFAKWMRKRRALHMTSRTGGGAGSKQKTTKNSPNEQDPSITVVENFLMKISPELLATRSFECKSYPRAIMYWEEYLQQKRGELGTQDTNSIYKKFQEIYSSIDDPDSLDGIAAKFPGFNPEQQILRYESTGRWDYALECYEASVKELNTWTIDDDNSNIQSKIFNCLKQAGRYDDLLSRLNDESKRGNTPGDWVRLGIEVSWLSGSWSNLRYWLDKTSQDNYEVNIGNALLSLKSGDCEAVGEHVQRARKGLAVEVSAANLTSLAQCHDSLIKLHALADLQDISSQFSQKHDPSEQLDSRLGVVGSDYTARRYLLALRRSAMSLFNVHPQQQVASSWIKSAKDARKQGQSALALQASIRAQMSGSDLGKVENARVLWDQGEQRKAPAMLKTVLSDQVLTTLENYRQVRDIPRLSRQEAKIAMLYTVWLDESSQETSDALLMRYKALTKMQPQWEKVHYKLAKYYNKLFDSQAELPETLQNMSFLDGEYVGQMVLNYLRSLQYGVKYIYESLPKLVTVWLDFAANIQHVGSKLKKNQEIILTRKNQLKTINKQIRNYSQKVPGYIFYVVLPQLLSRMLHSNDEVVGVIKALIVEITKQYPNQSLWYVFGSVNSHEKERNISAKSIVDKLKVTKSESSVNLRKMVEDAETMTRALIDLSKQKALRRPMTTLAELEFRKSSVPSNLVVPVQTMMSATLPNHPNAIKNHTAFPSCAKIYRIDENVNIQSSLQKPKRITIVGSDGNFYRILCKSNDDVRKDARLMEFARSIDNLLRTEDEASQRHLRINTYHVTPMTELCGLIEWVDRTDAMRPPIMNLLKNKGLEINWADAKGMYDKTRNNDTERLEVFRKLSKTYPSVMYEWFIETFPDPSSWLEARTQFVRTSAVMSIVGYIVGLGDRHSENLLLLRKTGAVMHVDFDMLFDKALTLGEPERVPFRLTQQMIGVMGVSGYEGLFRRSCEVSLKVLRTHEGMLMTVLEPFLHEPFVDWTDKKAMRGTYPMINGLRPSRSPEEAFNTIRNKIRGIKGSESIPLSVSGQVEYLIKLATNERNLSQMYIGWGAFL